MYIQACLIDAHTMSAHIGQATCTLDGVIEPTIAFLLEAAAPSAEAEASAAAPAAATGKL